MGTLMSKVAGLGAAALMTLTPFAAFADATPALSAVPEGATSLGIFQTTDRKMDFTAWLCGADGKDLCVKLTALRGSADIPRTRAYLNKFVLNQAKPQGTNKWGGHIDYQQYSGDGSATLTPGKAFLLHGCTFVVVCADFNLIPALPKK